MTLSRARLTGAVYLLYFLTAIIAATLIGRVPIAYSNAANLVANAGYVAVSVLLYQMFKPVSRSVASLALGITVVGCIVQSLVLFHLAPAHSSLPVFGLFNLTIGWLILKSTFLPRILGVLMALSGLGWLMVVVTREGCERSALEGAVGPIRPRVTARLRPATPSDLKGNSRVAL